VAGARQGCPAAKVGSRPGLRQQNLGMPTSVPTYLIAADVDVGVERPSPTVADKPEPTAARRALAREHLAGVHGLDAGITS
jgi:hypothetical protein